MKEKNLISNYINNEIISIPNQLNEKLYFKETKFNERKEFDQIKVYINDFIDGNPFNRFIVLPGLRGVGKSTLLFQTYDYLLREKNIAPNQILYLSCEDLNFITECNILEVVNIYLESQHECDLRTLKKKIFLLLDESQYDKNWALSGKIIYDKTQKIFMLFTGSSALNLETNADAARRMLKYDINPLNYSQHLKLKYNITLNKISKGLKEIIYEGNIDNAVQYEKKVKEILTNTLEYDINDWNIYFKYGGFPTLFYINHLQEQRIRLMDIISKIVHNDMANIKNFTTENQTNVNRVISFLALQRSHDVSYDKLAKHIKTSKSNIKNILDILEKTHLIFHLEAYGTSSKRIKKAWKYYFATSSLKHSLTKTLGNNSIQLEEYEGVLLENMVASILRNLSQNPNRLSYLYYDANKKNVDFLLQQEFQKPIPIEVGRGNKDKKQINLAMNNYDSSYGIIISNTKDSICKEDDIIFIPSKTFSLL